MRAVIMAGGKGTRMRTVSEKVPKSLLKLNGKPVLQHQLETLKREGINEVILLLSYMSEKIVSFLKTNNNFGMKISCVIELEPMGTAGGLNLISNLDNDFLLINGDIIFDIFLDNFIDFHNKKNGIATLFVHPNDHPFDSDLVQCDNDGKIESFIMKSDPKELYNNNVNAGLYLLKPAILEQIPRKKADLVNDIFNSLILKDIDLYGYQSSEYVKDMGTPSRMKEVEDCLISGKVGKKNLRNYQAAVFLDRDGVINKEVDQISNLDDLELLDGTIDAIKALNNSDYLSVVVTNQPAVAKGFCDIETIMTINKSIETSLGNKGAKLEAMYVCPHHPETGFPGENKEYKIDCNCRKPKIGLLEKAKKRFNIDYTQSFIVGDTTRDVMTGKNAGLRTILVETGYGGQDKAYKVEPDYIARDLNDAVSNIILKK